MEPLDSHLDVNSSDFKQNRERIASLVEELEHRLAAARQGGGAEYLAGPKEQGKGAPGGGGGRSAARGLRSRGRGRPASGLRRSSIRTRRSSSSRRLPRTGCTTTPRRPRGSAPASAARRGASAC